MCLQRLRDCSIPDCATIRQAMEALNRGGLEIVLVVDRQGRLLGTCTDGDVRRALLAGNGFESPILGHISRDFVSVGPHLGRAEVLDLMKARQIQQVPVIKADGSLDGLHLMRELVGAVERPNWAVLMAGGKGTRLQPLTNDLPKPMIPVAGRPILERIILHLVGYGMRRIFISVNYLGDMVRAHFRDGSQFGCSIEYLQEEKPLGTGGSLSLLPEIPKDPLLVMNGDLVTGLNVDEFLAFHLSSGYAGSVGIREYTHTVPFGTVDVRDGKIGRISEKPTYSWMVNTGCYLLNPALVTRVPQDTECTILALIEDALGRGEAIGAYKVMQDWIDVGRMPDLVRALGAPTFDQFSEQPDHERRLERAYDVRRASAHS